MFLIDMNNENKYILEWRDNILNAAKALNENNFSVYESLMNEVKNNYNSYKRDVALTYECNNFGMCNYIFEDALPSLFKDNKTAVKEFMTTIKEDKNLLSQFQFYKSLEKNNEKVDTNDYITETFNMACENIDMRTLKESNEKLAKIIKKYNIKPNDFIPQDKMELFENCNYIFSTKKKLSNLMEMKLRFDNVVDYTKKNYNTLNESKENALSKINEFNEKYGNFLNESEKSFVKEMFSSNSDKKEKLFNNLKNECLKQINKLIFESDNDNETNGLNELKEQIESKYFNESTLIKDVAKLLEINVVLGS